MKRKLIGFDAFRKIEESSLSAAQRELNAAEPVLAKTLGLDEIKLHCLSQDTATFATSEGTYVHAGYRLAKDKVVLENVQELVVEDEKAQSRKVAAKILDDLLDNKDANPAFQEYFSLPAVRRSFNESCGMAKKKKKKKDNPFAAKKDAKKLFVKAKPAVVKEWTRLANNLKTFLEFREYGQAVRESEIVRDEKGNVTGLSVPNSQRRNEGRLLSFNWKTLDHEVKSLRGKMKNLSEDASFCKAVAELKRHNGLSDDNALEAKLSEMVRQWPGVLYLTQSELAGQIAEALETAGVQTYDDQTCEFMADAVLQTAHATYADRVTKVHRLAGTQGDKYEEFKAVAEQFYPALDEAEAKEMAAYGDIFKALHEVYKQANAELRQEVAKHLAACESVLNKEVAPDTKVVEAAYEFLNALAEANLAGASMNWDVSNTPHVSVGGDHPRTAWNAQQNNAVPSNFEGDWGTEAPVSDGKSYKGNDAAMKHNAWGNLGGDEVNPYLPKAFEFKMKGEKSVVDEDGLGFESGNTWPELKNPVVPADVKPKMKSDNLVTDK